MKKVLKLLLYIVLSIAVTYFVISNVYMYPNVKMATDFFKHGTENSIIKYTKKIDADLKKSLNSSEDKKDDNKQTDVKVTSEKENEQIEKNYKTINELAVDYPMGTTYFSVLMSFGESQIEILCVSLIFGVIIGMNCFIFITDKKRNIKQIIILYVINIGVTLLVTELIQVLTVVLAYGTIYFVTISPQFILSSTAVFLFGLAMNKTVNDKKEQKLAEEKK